MYVGLRVKYSLFLSDFNKTWTSSTDFQRIRTYQISWKSARSGVVSCGQSDTDRDTMKLLVAFSGFANAPKTS